MNTTPDKKMTPMAAHIEWLKKERKTLYEFGYDVAADRISKAIDNATSLLEAEREYASQQAPASTPPVSANDAALMDVDKLDGVYAVNLSWGINYHPTDLSKVMKAKDCLFIGTGKECADFIYKNKPAPVSAMEDEWTEIKEGCNMPSDNEDCLVWTELATKWQASTFNNKRFYRYSNAVESDRMALYYFPDVVKWMPLPPPPSNR